MKVENVNSFDIFSMCLLFSFILLLLVSCQFTFTAMSNST